MLQIMPEDFHTKEGPVTVIISNRVKPGRKQEFEEWLSGISQKAMTFEGHLGRNIIRPANGSNQEYVVIFSFNSYENLKKWEESPIRDDWVQRVTDFTVGNSETKRVSGLEYWFTMPESPFETPPASYKMVIVTFIALFPLVNLVGISLNPLIGDLHRFIRLAIEVMIIVLLMDFLAMPLMIRLFSRWLHRK